MRDIFYITSFKEWLEQQGKINWIMGGVAFLLTYDDAKCMAVLSKVWIGGKLIQIGVSIRPLINSHTLNGLLAGQAKYLTFTNEKQKSK